MSDEHTPEHTPDTRPPLRVTYLVGSVSTFRRYCHDHGVSVHSPHVRHAYSAQHLRGLNEDAEIVFLGDWHTLQDGRRMQEWAAALRARRLGEI